MIDLLADPSSSNLAWQWVSAVLPGDTTSPWGKTLAIFTSTLFTLSALYLGYGTIHGIVSSAYSGKVLGDRWHQIWTPLRIVFGLGLLLPMPSTGFSGVHYLLRDVVARSGINLADATWETFVSTVAKDGVPIVPVSKSGSTVAMIVLRHEVCAAVYNAAGNAWGWRAEVPAADGQIVGERVFWSYGATCGAYSYTMPSGYSTFADSRRDTMAKLVIAFRKEAGRYAEIAAHRGGISSSDGINHAIADTTLSAHLVNDLRVMGTTFDATVVTAAKAEAASTDTASRSKLVAAAQQQGFLTAGMYWRNLSQVSELMTSLANETIEDTPPRADGDFGLALDRAFKILDLQVSGEAKRVSLSANDFASAGDENADFLTKLLAPVARSMAEWASSSSNNMTDTDAMGALISSGHAMISTAWAAIAAGGIAMLAASNWISSSVGAGGAAAWLLDWSKWVIGGLMIIGALRAYVIPIMPFVFIFMAGMTVMASLMEAMIALPLWAMRWTKMDNGHDFAGDSVKMGLLLIVNIALRPSLAVLALCAAYPVFNATLGTLDTLWPTAFLAQSGGHVVGLVGFLVMTAIQAYLVWYSTIKGFGLIWSLPDKVLAWVGQAGTGGEASMASGAFGGMIALAGRGTMPRLSSDITNIKGKRK